MKQPVLSEQLVLNSIDFLVLISEGTSSFEAIRKATGCKDRPALHKCLVFLGKAGLVHEVHDPHHEQRINRKLTEQGMRITEFIKCLRLYDHSRAVFQHAFESQFPIQERDLKVVEHKLRARQSSGVSAQNYVEQREDALDVSTYSRLLFTQVLSARFLGLLAKGELSKKGKELLTRIYLLHLSKEVLELSAGDAKHVLARVFNDAYNALESSSRHFVMEDLNKHPLRDHANSIMLAISALLDSKDMQENE